MRSLQGHYQNYLNLTYNAIVVGGRSHYYVKTTLPSCLTASLPFTAAPFLTQRVLTLPINLVSLVCMIPSLFVILFTLLSTFPSTDFYVHSASSLRLQHLMPHTPPRLITNNSLGFIGLRNVTTSLVLFPQSLVARCSSLTPKLSQHN